MTNTLILLIGFLIGILSTSLCTKKKSSKLNNINKKIKSEEIPKIQTETIKENENNQSEKNEIFSDRSIKKEEIVITKKSKRKRNSKRD